MQALINFSTDWITSKGEVLHSLTAAANEVFDVSSTRVNIILKRLHKKDNCVNEKNFKVGGYVSLIIVARLYLNWNCKCPLLNHTMC